MVFTQDQRSTYGQSRHSGYVQYHMNMILSNDLCNDNIILLSNDQEYLPVVCSAREGLGKVWDKLKTPVIRWPPERQEK